MNVTSPSRSWSWPSCRCHRAVRGASGVYDDFTDVSAQVRASIARGRQTLPSSKLRQSPTEPSTTEGESLTSTSNSAMPPFSSHLRGQMPAGAVELQLCTIAPVPSCASPCTSPEAEGSQGWPITGQVEARALSLVLTTMTSTLPGKT